jgi:hypothetical protein
VDGGGNVYIADSDCYEELFCSAALIRRVSPDGIITTIAGSGVLGYLGDDGPAASAEISAPYGMAADGPGGRASRSQSFFGRYHYYGRWKRSLFHLFR